MKLRRLFIVALIALSVLVPAALGGLAFVWCAPMERAMLRSCCPSASAGASHESAFEQPCCEGRRVTSLALFHLDAHPDIWVSPAPLLALLLIAAIFTLRPRPKPVWVLGYARRARAGPAPPLFLLHHALLN